MSRRRSHSLRKRYGRARDPWAPAPGVKARMTATQRKALAAYRFAVQQEDRYLGSVFVSPSGQRRVEALTKAAYDECKRLGLGPEHGL
jgi:hypothetical protein